MCSKVEKNRKSSKKVPNQPQLATVSIAVPASIMDNAQSVELRSYLAGQIARAACVFRVNEIIVFNDGYLTKKTSKSAAIDVNRNRSCNQMSRILQYLECPQYLRKYFFPIQNDLQYAGILNPLDTPHHLRQEDEFMFREGITTNKPMKTGSGSLVNVGLKNDVTIDKKLIPNVRVTVKIDDYQSGKKRLKGTIVSRHSPQIETGTYWGYDVRIANSFSEVFQKQSKYQYDIIIGTSDKGDPIESVNFDSVEYKHLLIVFGGLNGLEFALENDESLQTNDIRLMFDYYVNTLANQGSRTIRTEEAVLISLSKLLDCKRLKPFEL